MRIRLALTLDIRRSAEPTGSREVDMGSLVELADQEPDHPRIGFTSTREETA